MPFSTRRDLEDLTTFDPNNPFGEPPTDVNPPMQPGLRPNNVPPTQPWWDNGGMPKTDVMPPPQPSVVRPIPNKPPYPDGGRSPMDESSPTREGEDPRLAQIRAESPYNDANFNKPGGLRDQMRGPAYRESDQRMDNVLNKEPAGGVNEWKPGPNGMLTRPSADGINTDTYNPETGGIMTTMMAGPRRTPPDIAAALKKYGMRDQETTLRDKLDAQRNGVTPVPWSRRNRPIPI